MTHPVITAAEAASALGDTLDASLTEWKSGRSGLTQQDGLIAGRITDRTLLKGRRYGAASNLAVQVARRAIAKAGWTGEETRNAWLFAASSRGNAGELLRRNTWRRPSKRFSASNTLHSEIAAAVSIELGIHGPWQMISNGCSAGLDALGFAWMALKAGMTQRVLVVAVDLPLVPELLQDFRDTKLLSTNGQNDPLSPQTSGFHPGEAGVALTLELEGAGPRVNRYAANSDAYDSLVIPEEGARLAELLAGFDQPDLICPHATGTPNHAVSEMNALRTAYGPKAVPPLLLLKPLTGHTLGASGLLDVALISEAMRQGHMPGNLSPLTCPGGISLTVPKTPTSVLKIASGMGGHNAAVMLSKA